MNPWLEPFIMPFAEDGNFENQAMAAQKGIIAATEGIPIDIDQVFERPSILLAGWLTHNEIFLLRSTVIRVTLANICKLDIELVSVRIEVDLVQLPLVVAIF